MGLEDYYAGIAEGDGARLVTERGEYMLRITTVSFMECFELARLSVARFGSLPFLRAEEEMGHFIFRVVTPRREAYTWFNDKTFTLASTRQPLDYLKGMYLAEGAVELRVEPRRRGYYRGVHFIEIATTSRDTYDRLTYALKQLGYTYGTYPRGKVLRVRVFDRRFYEACKAVDCTYKWFALRFGLGEIDYATWIAGMWLDYWLLNKFLAMVRLELSEAGYVDFQEHEAEAFTYLFGLEPHEYARRHLAGKVYVAELNRALSPSDYAHPYCWHVLLGARTGGELLEKAARLGRWLSVRGFMHDVASQLGRYRKRAMRVIELEEEMEAEQLAQLDSFW